MEFNRNAAAKGASNREKSGPIVQIGLPEEHLSTLVDMTAMSYSDACDGLEVHDAEFCESVELVSKLVYEQAHCLGGGDAVWRNPRDGTFHHPSFPENQGRAYETVHQSRKDWTRVMLVEWVTTVMVERHPNAGCKPEEHQELHEHYEHWCQDILESEGELGLIRTLVACA